MTHVLRIKDERFTARSLEEALVIYSFAQFIYKLEGEVNEKVHG